MKLSRPVASAIGVAIVAASALALSAPANAATPGVTYVTAEQIATAVPGSTGWNQISGDPVSSSVYGLTGDNYLTVAYVLPSPIATKSGTAITTLADASSFATPDDVYAQIFWQDGNGQLQHFFAIDAGPAALTSDTALWFSSVFIGGNSVNTLADFDAAIAIDPAFPAATLVSLGVDSNTMNPVELQAFTVNGVSFSFLPEPVSSAPTSLTQTAYAATGVTITTTGFVPGEELEVYQSFPTASGPDGGSAPAVTADSNGAVTYTFRPAAGVTPLAGAYNLTFVGVAGVQFFDYAVTAEAVAAVLAATGTDSMVPVVAGGALLLGGAALAVIAVKRRRTV